VTEAKVPRDLLRKVENESFPLVGLRSLTQVRARLAEIEGSLIRRAREMGASSSDIGDALGITRQAAHQRLKNLGPAGDDVVVIPESEPKKPRSS
jgi:hypothetical protein